MPSSPRFRRSLLATAAVLVAVLVATLGGVALGGSSHELRGEPLRIGAGPDMETTFLAELMAVLLREAQVAAEVVPFSEARDSRQALELGAIDLRTGYTGEAWLEVLGRADPPGDPEESFGAVRRHDAREGIVWLRPSFGDGPGAPPANATFAFMVQGQAPGETDLQTMSQLAARLSEQPEAVVCVDQEFGNRPDGLRAVLAAYSVRSDREFLAADPDEAVRGVLAGDCLAGLTTATDGAAWGSGLRPLVDDLQVFPAFVPLPQVDAAVLEEEPRVREALQPLVMHLTTERLGRANARILAGEPIEAVAQETAAQLLALGEGEPLPTSTPTG